MEVYTDLVNDEEYFTSASPFISVEDEEGKIDALIGIQAKTISDPDMDSDDETAEKNLDHLWHFPSINKEPVEFKKFKEFKTEYFKGYAKVCVCVPVECIGVLVACCALASHRYTSVLPHCQLFNCRAF